jgi:1-acyl-sn-glycerol-3-phosphate acyltransferase
VSLERSRHDLPRIEGVKAPSYWFLRTFRWIGRVALRRRFAVRLHGAEHFPQSGPVILASNHIGLMDGPLMAIFSPRPVHALTKQEVFAGRLGGALRLVGQVPLDRMMVDPLAIKTCLRVLQDGKVVGIYPEGTRGTGEYHRVHGGVAYLALVSGAPIVPLVMLGSRPEGGGSNAMPAKGGTVHMVFGPPIRLDRQPWPRTQEQVRTTSMLLHREFLSHLDHAISLTGCALPGPITDLDPAEVHATRPVSLKEQLDD